MKKSSQVPLPQEDEEFIKKLKAITLKQIASFFLYLSIGVALGLMTVYFITGDGSFIGKNKTDLPKIINTTEPTFPEVK